MSSISRFLPTKDYDDSIQPVYFVYETEFHKLKQPFVHAVYYVFLVTKGTGTLQILNRSLPLETGTLFVVFPGTVYTMQGSEDLTYMYISFMGNGAGNLLSQTCLNMEKIVYPGREHLIDFWRSGIQRINRENANILTECVLLYTLSFFPPHTDGEDSKSSRIYDNILIYVKNHYTERDLTLKKIAEIFSYTEKYLSRLFKQNMNVNFNEYLNRLRIEEAIRAIGGGADNIKEIALLCGFGDPLYFSKVFKKHTGIPPAEYIKQRKRG